MGVKLVGIIALVMIFSGCAVSRTSPVNYIALLAPFEGRYREVGYDLYYAARLALKDAGYSNLELLAVDSGSSVEDAVERAEALALNSRVKIILAAGYDGTHARVQEAVNDAPMVIIGHWLSQPYDADVFMLASPELDRLITGDTIGGELFALKQFPKISDSLEKVRIISSATLPDVAFTERYINSDLYVDPPGLLAMLGYDAARMAAEAVKNSKHRQAVTTILKQMHYMGLNGEIKFENGYWVDAPVIEYRYNDDGQLTPLR